MTDADGVELIHKVRYLSPLVVEKNLAHTHTDFLHRLLQTSNPVFFESTAYGWDCFRAQELDCVHKMYSS